MARLGAKAHNREDKLASNYEVWEILNSEKLKPFWDRVRSIRATQMKKLLDEEDVSFAKAVKVLDKILTLPSEFEHKKNC